MIYHEDTGMEYTFREREFKIFEDRRNNSIRAGELLSQWMMSDFATESGPDQAKVDFGHLEKEKQQRRSINVARAELGRPLDSKPKGWKNRV